MTGGGVRLALASFTRPGKASTIRAESETKGERRQAHLGTESRASAVKRTSELNSRS
jgi:hypothetical protein